MKKLGWILGLMIAGCSLAPDAPPPEITPPAAWEHAPEMIGNAPAMDADWWARFGSKNLETLVTKSLADNPDLEAAEARMAQAQAAVKIAGASLFPSLDAQGNIGRTFNSRTVGGGSSAETGYSAGLAASYELDLFGKNRDRRRSAQATAEAVRYDHQAIILSITAQVAQAYVNLLALEARVDVAQKSLGTANSTLRTLRTRYQAGAISQLEVATQENFVHASDAALQALTQQREAARNALAVLVGIKPEDLKLAPESLTSMTVPDVPLAMPAEWIAQRPDIAGAEAQLAAANFDIGVARAAFFPSLTLSASSVIGATPLRDPSASVSSLAAGVTAPLFRGGALQGGLEQATARQQELAADYRKTALQAFEDTENAMDGVSKQQARVGSLEQAARAAQTAYAATHVRFDAGAIDTLTLLDSERSWLSAQDSLASARAARVNAAIDLYRAMGGGWKRN